MNYTSKELKVMIPLVIVFLCATSYGGFMLTRYINYKLSYESKIERQVNRIIDERISSECLLENEK